MKRKISQVALILSTVILTFCMNGCKSAVKDADLETSVENSIKNNPDLTGITVDVKDGVATLSGRVTSESAKSAAATAASGIKGVKSVNNNIIVETTTPIEINPDETLRNSVRDAIKDHPGVTVDVNDGVITVTGEIKRADLPTLMQKLNALNPKKVENKLTIK
jgi:hyperosmotically inducible protein